MITPQFKIEQNDTFIIIYIKLKYVKISEVEFFIENNNFRFFLKPYFLNLFFSDNLVQSDNCASKYNIENSILECKLEKQVKGTLFKDIDLLNNLLDNSINQTKDISKKIQVIDEKDENNLINNKKEFKLDEINELLNNDLNFQFKNLTLIKNYTYGFNNEFTEVFNHRDV